ncbi:MAG: hypothetical protein MJ033_03335 [Victivallaceae bacterium]|nr:hypothetical protein [Victivallaceae bacterium]
MAHTKKQTVARYDIPELTASRAANPASTIHQAIAMLLNAPNQTMTEQQFLVGLSNLPAPAASPRTTLRSMTSTAPQQYGDVVSRKGNMIVFNPIWFAEIKKYQW